MCTRLYNRLYTRTAAVLYCSTRVPGTCIAVSSIYFVWTERTPFANEVPFETKSKSNKTEGRKIRKLKIERKFLIPDSRSLSTRVSLTKVSLAPAPHCSATHERRKRERARKLQDKTNGPTGRKGKPGYLQSKVGRQFRLFGKRAQVRSKAATIIHQVRYCCCLPYIPRIIHMSMIHTYSYDTIYEASSKQSIRSSIS